MRRGEFVVRRLDEEEYARRSPSYPAELLPRLEHAICEATTMLAERVFPFDDTLLGWRPDGA
ncbi:hypothetical protein [Nannocystis sp.]|uniref:hypothetical protein n=1 Tax=Nannocystis sp. TaxID=1962667 RepID=UPI00242855A0|nr:hypothetical protein [Nannocystis sp.]MBK7828061.1 hypothetical protein [Nannocystis sp.]MBK9752407.1 hypothetical protein [Nannocystis sp.]